MIAGGCISTQNQNDVSSGNYFRTSSLFDVSFNKAKEVFEIPQLSFAVPPAAKNSPILQMGQY